jgi:hypothetical protein
MLFVSCARPAAGTASAIAAAAAKLRLIAIASP